MRQGSCTEGGQMKLMHSAFILISWHFQNDLKGPQCTALVQNSYFIAGEEYLLSPLRGGYVWETVQKASLGTASTETKVHFLILWLKIDRLGEGTCAANWWQISSRCVSPAVGQLFSWDVSFIVMEKTSLKKQLRGSSGKPIAGSNCHSNNIYSINVTHIPFWNIWRVSHFKCGAGFVLHY